MRHMMLSRNSLEQNVMVYSCPQMKNEEEGRFNNKGSGGMVLTTLSATSTTKLIHYAL